VDKVLGERKPLYGEEILCGLNEDKKNTHERN
jgi:hypothetical protein